MQMGISISISIPPLTRILLALLFAISIAHQITRYAFGSLDPEFLALIPQWSLFYPWVYFTATFAEQNVITLLIAAATILYGGKYLERAWGSREFARFLLLVTVLPNLFTAFVYVLWFAITRDDARAYARSQPLSLRNTPANIFLLAIDWLSSKVLLLSRAPSLSLSSSLFLSIQ